LRPSSRPAALALLLAGAASLGLAKPVIVPKPPKPRRVPVASVDVVQGPVQLADASQKWRPLDPRKRLATGERVRTDAGAVALVRLPWMTLLMAPLTELGISNPGVLSTSLESGRLEQNGERGIVKLDAGPVRIRGRGHVVVRRDADATAVSVFGGAFSVESSGEVLQLVPGTGAVVAFAHPLRAEVLPATAGPLRPGRDPAYVQQGGTLDLAWSPAGTPAHVQILGPDDRPLLVRDVAGSPLHIEVPDLGTYRWRVTLRDARGLEGPPSAFGAFAVVEK
jgi:hypothetical protein